MTMTEIRTQFGKLRCADSTGISRPFKELDAGCTNRVKWDTLTKSG